MRMAISVISLIRRGMMPGLMMAVPVLATPGAAQVIFRPNANGDYTAVGADPDAGPQLTMNRAKKVAAARDKIDSLVKANPHMVFFTVTAGKTDDEAIAGLARDLMASPKLGEALQATGITAGRYAEDLTRIQRAFARIAAEAPSADSAAAGGGQSRPALDILFVKKHEEGLEALGFKKPPKSLPGSAKP